VHALLPKRIPELLLLVKLQVTRKYNKYIGDLAVYTFII
jgi:hypothetical protein